MIEIADRLRSPISDNKIGSTFSEKSFARPVRGITLKLALIQAVLENYKTVNELIGGSMGAQSYPNLPQN